MLVVVVDSNEILPFKRGGVSDGNLEGNAVSGKDLLYVTQHIAQATYSREKKETNHQIGTSRTAVFGTVPHDTERDGRPGNTASTPAILQHGTALSVIPRYVTYCHICFA